MKYKKKDQKVPIIPTFHFLKFTITNETIAIISKLLSKISSGYDNINNLQLKLSTPVIVPIFLYLINLSFREGVFPVELAKAKVFPLHNTSQKCFRCFAPVRAVVLF